MIDPYPVPDACSLPALAAYGLRQSPPREYWTRPSGRERAKTCARCRLREDNLHVRRTRRPVLRHRAGFDSGVDDWTNMSGWANSGTRQRYDRAWDRRQDVSISRHPTGVAQRPCYRHHGRRLRRPRLGAVLLGAGSEPSPEEWQRRFGRACDYRDRVKGTQLLLLAASSRRFKLTVERWRRRQ